MGDDKSKQKEVNRENPDVVKRVIIDKGREWDERRREREDNRREREREEQDQE